MSARPPIDGLLARPGLVAEVGKLTAASVALLRGAKIQPTPAGVAQVIRSADWSPAEADAGPDPGTSFAAFCLDSAVTGALTDTEAEATAAVVAYFLDTLPALLPTLRREVTEATLAVLLALGPGGPASAIVAA